MAVVGSATIIEESQSGVQNADGTKEFSAVYQVRTDSAADGPNIVLAATGLPALYSTYAAGNDTDTSCYCVSLAPSRVAGSRLVWNVQISWKTLDFQGGGSGGINVGDNGLPTANPLAFADDVEIGYAAYTGPAMRCENVDDIIWSQIGVARAAGTIGPAVNSALEIFDPPPERDFSRLFFRVTGNRAALPFPAMDSYRDAINNDRWTLIKPAQGINITFNEYTCKMRNIGGSWQIQNNTAFWRLTFEWEVKDLDDDPGGWRYDLLDQGYHYASPAGYPDGLGGTVPAIDVNSPEIRRAEDYRGNAVGPVLLDGFGQPLGRNKPGKYLRYKIYKELPFQPLI